MILIYLCHVFSQSQKVFLIYQVTYIKLSGKVLCLEAVFKLNVKLI